MEDSEKNRYIEFLIQQKEERDRTIADKDAFIKNLQDTLNLLKAMHESDSKKIDEMLVKINDLTAQLKLKNKQTYADKSQKGITKKGKSKSPQKPEDRDRNEERDDFDGTNCERPADPSEIPAEETKAPCPEKVERKNSLFFGNHAKAEMSALYHTFIAARPLVACKARTCQMMGMSVLKYFKSLFSAIAKGRTDYENMLPMTICLSKAA